MKREAVIRRAFVPMRFNACCGKVLTDGIVQVRLKRSIRVEPTESRPQKPP